MRITNVRMQNFRSFKDCTVNLDIYTSLVGPNGAGKSTVLAALNVFFRETESASTDVNDLDAQDFHNRDTTKPIVITVTFGDLSEAEKQTFKEYYRHGSLTVSAEAIFDDHAGKGHVRQFGQRLGIEAFKPFFSRLNAGASASELNAEYEKLQSAFSDLPKATSKDAKKKRCTLTKRAMRTRVFSFRARTSFTDSVKDQTGWHSMCSGYICQP